MAWSACKVAVCEIPPTRVVGLGNVSAMEQRGQIAPYFLGYRTHEFQCGITYMHWRKPRRDYVPANGPAAIPALAHLCLLPIAKAILQHHVSIYHRETTNQTYETGCDWPNTCKFLSEAA